MVWALAASFFPDWPPIDWIDATRGKHHRHSTAALSAPRLEALASNLRRWSSSIIAGAGDDDEGCETMREGEVSYLDGIVKTTSGSVDGKAMHRQTWR